MLSLTVAYPYSADRKFDMDYYLNKHLPKLTKAPGSKVHSVYVEQGMTGMVPDSPPAYFCILHAHFKSLPDLMETLAAAGDLAADFPNYSDVTPLMQVAEVKELPNPL